MYIVVAPQSLKGSLDAQGVGLAIAAGIRRVWPDADIRVVPVADGGEGTVRALVAATGGALRHAMVTGPLGEPVTAEYGMLGGDQSQTAVIEMAAASGLPLVPTDKRDPRLATTRGTGELMRAALDAGAQRLLIGIGGSATNDGGAGMAQALGARLLDAQGSELPQAARRWSTLRTSMALASIPVSRMLRYRWRAMSPIHSAGQRALRRSTGHRKARPQRWSPNSTPPWRNMARYCGAISAWTWRTCRERARRADWVRGCWRSLMRNLCRARNSC